MAKSIFVGRTHEKAILQGMVDSGRAELLALYGRRRVGKTHLIRSFFADIGGTYLEVTGTRKGRAALQRRRFRESLERGFVRGQVLPDFRSWDDALTYLTTRVEERAHARPGETITLFFDELPWLATPRSGLLPSLDYHWNARLSRISEVKVVLCGSAASWMLKRVVHAKGGLHNRLTHRMRLEPFTLAETIAYLRARRIRLRTHEALELYLAIGGVPYYLSLIERGESVGATVGRLCFEREGPLQNEFHEIFASLFDQHEDHVAILRALSKRKDGLTRNDILESTGMTTGGAFNRRLVELEEAGFIGRGHPFNARVKSTLWRIIDEYTLFWFKWMQAAPRGVLARGGTAYWQSRAQTPGYRAWAGYAFEGLCLKHARELQYALGIDNLVSQVATWRFVPKRGDRSRSGAQIDLLFDRRDDVINLCEMKFSREPFVVTKAHARTLRDKITTFETRTKTKKRVVLTLVCPAGMAKNIWSDDLVDEVLDIKALVGKR